MVGRWLLPDMSDFAERVGAWVYFVLMAAIWLILAVGVAYRLVTFTYRVTAHSLMVDFGSRYPPEPPLLWKDVTDISHGASWLDRSLGVGWVKVTASGRAVTMTGVRDPKAFADAIAAARGGMSPIPPVHQ
jgi:hypothetical protein